MKTQDFLNKFPSETGRIRPRIYCVDGFNVSIQASEYHYSIPRMDDAIYDSVEIGYPSKKESLILPFAEEKGVSTSTVYGYVPIEIVDEMLEKHGGIDEERTFKK